MSRLTRLRTRTGLRGQFNLLVMPLAAGIVAAMIWADYRRESNALMQAHALHGSAVAGGAVSAPLDPSQIPAAVAQRSMRVHAGFGAGLLAALGLILNVALSVLILQPVRSMRARLAAFEHGYWRLPVDATGADELGALQHHLQRLGPELDALVSHLMKADRLTMLALLSRQFERETEADLTRIATIAARFTMTGTPEARRDGHELADAVARIMKAVRRYDAPFTLLSTRQ